jgi:hypothetical protein
MKAEFKQKNIPLLKPSCNNECVFVCVCVLALCIPACKAHLFTQHHIVIWGQSGCTIFFFTLTHKGHDFRQESHWTSTVCFGWVSVQLLSETSLVVRTERDMIKHVYCSSYQVPLLLSDWNEIWILSTDFRKILKYQILWKSVHGDLSSMRRDRQTDRRTDGRTEHTDMTKLIVVFRNFANAPKKNGKSLYSSSPVVVYICSGCYLIMYVCGFTLSWIYHPQNFSPHFFATTHLLKQSK